MAHIGIEKLIEKDNPETKRDLSLEKIISLLETIIDELKNLQLTR